MLQGGGIGDYTSTPCARRTCTQSWATVAFLLALFGFGAKAGMLPLHVWLPEAHPAAPSPVSALMSGVMLKTAIYGMLRVTFDLLGHAAVVVGRAGAGAGSGHGAVRRAVRAVQRDMKRLLAYSSIENIGIILLGIGLAIIFLGSACDALAALALIAALYHSLNHALFKSLLFLGTGVDPARHRRAQPGATGRPDPSACRGPRGSPLIGALAISGLPPLNGFVSEWLLLQAFLLSPGLPNSVHQHAGAGGGGRARAGRGAGRLCDGQVLRRGLPRPAARGKCWKHAHDAGGWERVGMLWLAAGCVVLGCAAGVR